MKTNIVIDISTQITYLAKLQFWAQMLSANKLAGFFNTLTANYEYSRSKRENLPLPIQMHLSEKAEIFYCTFTAFLKSSLNFKHFEKNEPYSSTIS